MCHRYTQRKHLNRMRGLLQKYRVQLVLLILTLFLNFKQHEALVTKHLEIGSGPKTFTLQLNATTEIVFSFPDVGDHGANYTVYVQHKPLGAYAFDRKCLLRQSRKICTTINTMCSCLERAVGMYSLRHVFTKTDEGRWLFTLQGSGSKSEEYLDITVKVINGSGPGNTTNATVIVAVASPFAIIVVASVIFIVMSLCKRLARCAERNTVSCDDKGVAARADSRRRQKELDTSSASYASPDSVVSLREYTAFSHPPQQPIPVTDPSLRDSTYENIPCQQRQWKRNKSERWRSRFTWRFPSLASAKMDNNEESPYASVHDENADYETPTPLTTLTNPTTSTTYPHHSQGSSSSVRLEEASRGLDANTSDLIQTIYQNAAPE